MRFRVRLFVRADSSSRAVHAALAALHQGFWLGILSTRDINDLANWQYAGWLKYSNQEYNKSGLDNWERDCILKFFTECKYVLVAAAGGGREVLALARQGYGTAGFECCGPLGLAARELLEQEGVDVPVLDSQPNEVPKEMGVFDGAVVGWGAYMHIQGRDRRIHFLKELAGHMKPGSPVLLSFFERTGDPRSMRWIAKIANSIRWMRFNRERVETGDTLVNTFDHHFTRHEVDSELEAAGFCLEFYASSPYAHAVGRVKSGQK